MSELFVLSKNGRAATQAGHLCRTADQKLCVWEDEKLAEEYAKSRSFDNWMVRPAVSDDFAIVGRMKRNRHDKSTPCYKIMKERETVSKKTTSVKSNVELFEDYESRRFAISSKAESEKEFLVEVSQVLASSSVDAGNLDWNTRLREVLPLIVDMCCKYRGYKADSVFERRELVAGDLEMPKKIV